MTEEHKKTALDSLVDDVGRQDRSDMNRSMSSLIGFGLGAVLLLIIYYPVWSRYLFGHH